MTSARAAIFRLVLVASLAHCALTPSAWGQPSFYTYDGTPRAVSADGRFVVGTEQRQAFRWSSAGGLELLGHLPGGTNGYAQAVSADGSVMAGSDIDNNSRRTAFRWESGVMQPLSGPVPPGTSPDWRVEYAYDMSDDGSLIVGGGFYGFPAGSGGAYRWTQQGGFEPFLAPDGFIPLGAGTITPDGQLIGGAGTWDGVHSDPFLWSEPDGM